MKSKLLVLVASLLSLTSAAVAQESGLIPSLLDNLLGLNFGSVNPLLIAVTLATFGYVNIMVYAFLKLLAVKLVDTVDFVSKGDLFGRGESRNLVLIFSVLFTFAGLFGYSAIIGSEGVPSSGGIGGTDFQLQQDTLLGGYVGLSVLALSATLFGGLAIILLGGIGAVIGGAGVGAGVGGRMAGEGVKAAGGAAGDGLAEANKQAKKAKKVLPTGESDAEAGNFDDAEKEFEETVELLESVDGRLGKAFKTEIPNELEKAREKLKNTEEKERDQDTRVKDLEQRLKAVNTFVVGIVKGQGNADEPLFDTKNGDNVIKCEGGPEGWAQGWDDTDLSKLAQNDFDHGLKGNGIPSDFKKGEFPDEFGMEGIKDQMEKVEEDLNIIQKDYRAGSNSFTRAVDRFDNAVEDALNAHVLLERVIDLLNEVEEDTEQMEKIAQNRKLDKLHNENQSVIDEENKLESVAEQLEGYSDDIREKIMEELKEVEELIKYNENDLNGLKEALEYSNKLDGLFTDIIQNAENSYDTSKWGYTKHGVDKSTLEQLEQNTANAKDMTQDIENAIDGILNELDQEDKEVAGEMENMLQRTAQVNNSHTQANIAKQTQKEIRSFLQKSRFTSG
ncbi:hypothetical protein GLU64_00585 [Nanohaloarchaea archaeon]|nr:hypothetical protein [Candidatus Nanohaloarchaea archaeon]